MNNQLLTAALQRITAADEGIPRPGVAVKFRFTGTKVMYVKPTNPESKYRLALTPGTNFHIWHRGGVFYIRLYKKTMAIFPADVRALAKQCVRMDAQAEKEAEKVLARCMKVIKTFQASLNGIGTWKALEAQRVQLLTLTQEYDKAAKTWRLADCNSLIAKTEVALKKVAQLPAQAEDRIPADYLKKMLRLVKTAPNYWDDEVEGALFLLNDLMDWLVLAAALNENNRPAIRRAMHGDTAWREQIPDDVYEYIDNL